MIPSTHFVINEETLGFYMFFALQSSRLCLWGFLCECRTANAFTHSIVVGGCMQVCML